MRQTCQKSTQMARLRSRPSPLGYRLGARVQAGRAPRDRISGRRHLSPSPAPLIRRGVTPWPAELSRPSAAAAATERGRAATRASGTAKVGTITSGYVEMRRFVLAELSRSRLFGSPAQAPPPITAHLVSAMAGAALSGILATWREKQCQAVPRTISGEEKCQQCQCPVKQCH